MPVTLTKDEAKSVRGRVVDFKPPSNLKDEEQVRAFMNNVVEELNTINQAIARIEKLISTIP